MTWFDMTWHDDDMIEGDGEEVRRAYGPPRADVEGSLSKKLEGDGLQLPIPLEAEGEESNVTS